MALWHAIAGLTTEISLLSDPRECGTLDKDMYESYPNWGGEGSMRSHHTTWNSGQLITYKSFIYGIFHLIFFN